MPIRPERMALYPGGSIRSPEWRSIRERIRERAENRCEECDVANGAVGYREPSGEFIEPMPCYVPGNLFHRPDLPKPCKVFRIVCTVAHVDGDETNNDDDNLRFWCQRCHNRHDAPARAAGRKRRARCNATA